MPISTPEESALRWVPGSGPVTLQPLAAGLVNDSYRVLRNGRPYSMRLAADLPGLGIDRDWECRVLHCAARAGVAPAIACCEPSHGILVTEWTSGRAWTAQELRLPHNIRALTGLLRRIHALPFPGPARLMSPADWIAHYERAAAARIGSPHCAISEGLRGAANDRLKELAELHSAGPVLCHSDLHRLNLAAGEHLLLLDWEYAHGADPYWDLASWIANNDETAGFAAKMLAGYLERAPSEAESQRLALLTWLYDYVCLLWSEMYMMLRPGPVGGEVSIRAERLALRLHGGAGGREPEVPAN